jgi:hypothetical protein
VAQDRPDQIQCQLCGSRISFCQFLPTIRALKMPTDYLFVSRLSSLAVTAKSHGNNFVAGHQIITYFCDEPPEPEPEDPPLPEPEQYD